MAEKCLDANMKSARRAGGKAPRKGIPNSPVIGRMTGWLSPGRPLVSYPGCSKPRAARTVVALPPDALGADVVLLFADGRLDQPIVMGVLQPAGRETLPLVVVEKDGDRLLLTAENQIVLRCGDASITLTKAGKVLIHGAYVSSRSTGMNRIRGGVVHIN